MYKNKLLANAAIALAIVAFTPLPVDAQNRARGLRPAQANEQQRAMPDPSPEETLTQATAAARAAGLVCNVTEARFAGRGGVPTEATAGLPDNEQVEEAATFFEAACDGAPGFILVQRPDSATYMNCLGLAASRRGAAPTENEVACTLPANLDSTAIVANLASTLNLSCQVDGGQWLGRAADGTERYEVSCVNQDGYWINTAVTGAATDAMECLEVQSGGGECALTTPANQAAGLQSRLAGTSAPACTIEAARYMGSNERGRYYEAKCADAAGLVVRFSPQNTFDQAYDCIQAQGIGGGCKLTDVSSVLAQAEQSRQQRLTSMGVQCAVTDSVVLGEESGGLRREVVEFQCSDRPLGLVAFLPPSGDEGATAMDCLSVRGRSISCRFVDAEALHGAMTRMMAAGNRTCDVVDYEIRSRMANDDGDVIEVKCADGSGFYGEFLDNRQTTRTVQTCANAARMGDPCEL